MKQLKKLVLHKTTPLTVPQMKNITGGYDGGGYDGFSEYDELCGEGRTKYTCILTYYDTITGYCCGTSATGCEEVAKRLYTDAGINPDQVFARCW